MKENTFPTKISDSSRDIIDYLDFAINSGASIMKVFVNGWYRIEPKITILWPDSNASYNYKIQYNYTSLVLKPIAKICVILGAPY